jgi:uncharacterized membrane protein (DUF485 family)
MSKSRSNRDRNMKASGLLPGDVRRNLSEQKQAMLELIRKEERAFRRRKVAAAVYWILAAMLFWLPVLMARGWSSTRVFQAMVPIGWIASFVLFAAAVVSTISLMVRRARIRDAQILAALHDIDETLQQLVRNHDDK